MNQLDRIMELTGRPCQEDLDAIQVSTARQQPWFGNMHKQMQPVYTPEAVHMPTTAIWESEPIAAALQS
jgi:hypothetical protein